jgi:hypothetical protein
MESQEFKVGDILSLRDQKSKSYLVKIVEIDTLPPEYRCFSFELNGHLWACSHQLTPVEKDQSELANALDSVGLL